MIGICDSGIGGLIVYQKLKALLPDASFLYLADQAYAPYGERSQAEIVVRMKLVLHHLADQGATMVVIACNTATVNAIDELRKEFPNLLIVGMEPAIKPAAVSSDKIIVLGTNSTVHNQRYQELVSQYASGKIVWNVGAPELVRQVEAGELDQADLLKAKIDPYIIEGAQALVIGCSHFSFLIPIIQQLWPHLKIFDGADGVARRASELYESLQEVGQAEQDRFVTTSTEKSVTFVAPAIKFQHVKL